MIGLKDWELEWAIANCQSQRSYLYEEIEKLRIKEDALREELRSRHRDEMEFEVIRLKPAHRNPLGEDIPKPRKE